MRIKEIMEGMSGERVEWRRLKEVAEMKRGTSATKKTLGEGEFPVISGGREPAFYCDKSNREGETITVAGSGAGAGYVQYWNEPIFVCDAFSVVGHEGVMNMRFLYHYLKMNQTKICELKKGAGVPHVYISDIEDLLVPVPAMAVQRGIGEFLDRYEELERELERELEGELELRRKEYGWWRERVMRKREGWGEKRLGEVADIRVGRKPTDILVNGDYEYINAGTTLSGYTNEYNCDGDVVTTPSRGQGGIGFVGYQKDKFWLGPLCYMIKSKREDCLTKFLYYYLSTNNNLILDLKKEGGTPAVNLSDLLNINILVPPLDEQERIAGFLDRYEELVGGVESGLPGEIRGRRKEKEWWRERIFEGMKG